MLRTVPKEHSKLLDRVPPMTTKQQPRTPRMVDKSVFPIQGKWRNFLLRRFSNLYAEGKEVEDMLEEDMNVDPDNIPRLVPLVALLAGKPSMLETAYDAAAQLQKSDLMLTSVMAACRLVEQYILDGASADERSLEKVIEDLKKRIVPSPSHWIEPCLVT